MVLRPISIPKDAKDCLISEGKVIGVYEGGIHDIVFILEGDNSKYYINRGMENGLVIEDLKKELIGNKVTIRYPKHWTPLNPNRTMKHLSILEYAGREIFNEIK